MKVGCFCAEMKTNTVFEISREQLDLHFGLISEALGALLDPWAVIMALLEGVFFRVTFHPALETGAGGTPRGGLRRAHWYLWGLWLQEEISI